MLKHFILSVILSFLAAGVYAQVSIKTEYMPSSKYHDEDKNKNGGKGDMKTIDGAVRLPVSVKYDEKKRLTAWALALNGSYASLDNKNLSKELCVSELLNVQLGIIHTRPISEKWSVMGILGAGWYTSDLKKINSKRILGQGGILFIKHAKPNLDWGVGVALNNVLGYPMIFPSLYLNWKLEGKYKFSLSMYNSFDLSASMRMNDYLILGLIVEADGLSAAVEKDGKDMIFANQYAYAGIQPEFIIGKGFSVPVVAGVAFNRETYFTERNLKAIFDSKDNYPGFGVSPYFSVGLRYGF